MPLAHRRQFLNDLATAAAPVALGTMPGWSAAAGAEPPAGARSDRDLMFLPGYRQRELLLDKKVSAVELTEAALRRIEALEGKLHAFITVDREGALKAAQAADEALRRATSPKELGP